MTTITPKNAGEVRNWRQRNHARQSEGGVIYVRAKHGRSMTWSDAVDEAICFGWIDTTVRPIDDRHYAQRFTRRKKGSKWSQVNVKKVERLTAAGLMSRAGLEQVELAKAAG